MRTLLNSRKAAGEWAGTVPSLLVLFVLIVYPLGTLVMQVFLPHVFDLQMNWSPSLGPLKQVFTDRANLTAVGNSLFLGLFASLVATVFGAFTAFGARRASKGLRIGLSGAIWIVFFTPSYVIAEGWLILMQDGGIFAQLFGLHNGWSAWFFTRSGLILVMGLRYFPFVHLAMEQAIQNVGGELLNAGRILGANKKQVFRKILLPLLAPALLAGASIAFAEGFGDFGFAAAITPQMHIPLITYQIYSALNEAPVNYPAAAGLSMLLIVITAVVLWLQMWWLRRKSYATVSTHTQAVVGEPAGQISLSTVIAIVLTVIALVFPVGANVIQSLWKSDTAGLGAANWSLANYASALQVGGDGLASLNRSLIYALAAAFITAAISLYVAYGMSFRKSRATQVVNLVTMATIAIPGVVLAASFIFAWNATWLMPIHLVLYGTSVCLEMAYIAGSLPYAVRLVVGAMSQLSPNLVRAAHSLGAGHARILVSIVIPLVSATAISIFFITFTGTMFELPASSLLYPAGQPPFPVLIQSKFDAFEWGTGSALTVVGVLIVFLSYSVGRLIAHRYQTRHTRQKKRTRNDASYIWDSEIQSSMYW